MNYGETIKKGTMVRIRTTNGGDSVCCLAEGYRPTYDAVIESRDPRFGRISAGRIASIEVVLV